MQLSLYLLFISVVIATSTKAFFKGVETWKKESIMKKVRRSILSFTCLPLSLTFLFQHFALSDNLMLPFQEASVVLESDTKADGELTFVPPRNFPSNSF